MHKKLVVSPRKKGKKLVVNVGKRPKNYDLLLPTELWIKCETWLCCMSDTIQYIFGAEDALLESYMYV